VNGRCLVRLNDTYVTGLNDTNAKNACTLRAGAGARLVLPTSGGFNQAVRALGRKLTRIDVSDIATDGAFLTSAGAVPDPTFYATNHPVDVVGAQDCVVARTTSPGAWIGEPCTRARGVICEIDPQ
jgi:Lectin C-type domain